MQFVPTIQPTLNPSVHMPNTVGKDSPTILLVGDSISTPIPTTTFDETGSLWGILRAAVERQNTNINPSFVNRGIGGARWDHLSDNKFSTLTSTGLSLPDWVVDGGYENDSWIDTVVDQAPNAIFFHFGMNDSDIFVEANFQDVMSDIQLRLPNTDLVFITNMVPNLYSSIASIGGISSQNGRLFVAERIRTYANYYGYGLIDIGRDQARKVAGFDPAAAPLNRTRLSASGTLPYTMPSCDLDFGFTADVPYTAMQDGLRLSISQAGSNSESWLEITDEGDKVAVEYAVLDNAAGRFRKVVSDIDVPTSGTVNLSVFIAEGVARVEVDGVVVDDGPIMRHGGRFSPILSSLTDSAETITITTYSGTFLEVAPQATFADVFGSTNIFNAIEGGNDSNHPTALGWAIMYAPTFDQIDLNFSAGISNSVKLDIMDDNTATSLAVPTTSGTFTLWCDNVSGSTAVVGASVHYYAGADATVLFSQQGSLTDVISGTALGGTTGADTRFTISVRDGFIDLENRRGLSIGSIRYRFS